MSATVLLTGATGFIGRQVLHELTERQLDLRLIVREGSLHKLADGAEAADVIQTADLFRESTEWWQEAMMGIDTVIHLAWYVEPGRYLNSPKNLDCLAGTLEMARAAAVAGVRRVVGVGTCFEYDLDAGDLSVDTPLLPRTTYAAAKAAAYLALSQWLPSQGVEFLWCRVFYLYGDGEDPRRLVPYLRSTLSRGQPAELTSGTQVRDFLDVADAAGKIAAEALGSRQGPVNICSGRPVTIRQIAEDIAAEYGARDLLRFGARAEDDTDPPRVVGVE